MPGSLDPKRHFLDAATKFLMNDEAASDPRDEPPRLTPRAIERTRMPRTRDRILANLEDMYKEAFERAKALGDDGQQQALDFSFRREQLYFEVLLDIRDAMERRP
jgi:hypothetical protein